MLDRKKLLADEGVQYDMTKTFAAAIATVILKTGTDIAVQPTMEQIAEARALAAVDLNARYRRSETRLTTLVADDFSGLYTEAAAMLSKVRLEGKLCVGIITEVFV